MRTRGRPVLGGFSGLFAGLFLGLDLLFFGAIRLDSVLLTLLPVFGLVGGVALAIWAPLGRTRGDNGRAAPTPPSARH